MSDKCMSVPCIEEAYAPVPCSIGSVPRQSLEDFIKLDESFALKLTKLIDAKGISDVECYKKANVSKQTWYKLMTDKHYKPNKKTAISFAVALELSLDESGKREYAEYLYKYGEEYSAPEIPSVVQYGETAFVFTGWSPELNGTQIMSDENLLYKAQYETRTYYADYTELDEAVAEANEIMQDEEYDARYTEDSRNRLEAAVSAVEYDLVLEEQETVDAFLENINYALDNMIKNKHRVAFIDDDGKEFLCVDADYGSIVDVPDIPLTKVCDEAEHYTFIGWDKSTDGCAYLTDTMLFTAIYINEEHSFTNYIVDVQASASGSKTLVAQCDMGCSAKDTVVIIGSADDHIDEDGDGVCDNDGEPMNPNPSGEPTDDCDHLCHKDGFMGFIWKIIRFFIRLFKAQPLCECGVAHY